MLNHLESLCRLCGASGQEHPVRDYLIEQIKPLGLPYQVDPLGNLIVEKKGKQTPSKKWMIGAHTDEVGLIVTYINENGTMKLAPVGGIDPSVVIGRAVQVGEQRIPGVIGAKPIHLLSKEDRKKAPSFSNLYLDIGAANRKEAEQFVQPGTYVHFRSGYTLLGGGKLVRSKALDDRIGCAILLDLLQKDVPYDFTAAFHVQEEIGLRGAKAAAYTINPDFALILETTTAADFSSAQGDAKVCQLGKGPVVSLWIAAHYMTVNCTVWHSLSVKKQAFPARPKPVLQAETTAEQFMSAETVFGHWQFLHHAEICIPLLVLQTCLIFSTVQH